MELRWLSSDYGRVKTLQYLDQRIADGKTVGWVDVPVVNKSQTNSLEEKFAELLKEHPLDCVLDNYPGQFKKSMINEMARIAEQHFTKH